MTQKQEASGLLSDAVSRQTARHCSCHSVNFSVASRRLYWQATTQSGVILVQAGKPTNVEL